MGRKIFVYDSLWEEHGGAPGLGLLSFDPSTGEIKLIKKLVEGISFNCSCIDQNRTILYLCNETGVQENTLYSTGRIYGYQLNRETGDVEELFHRDTFCPNPAYLTLMEDGKYMAVAHHSSATHAPTFSTSIELDAQGNYVPVIQFDDAVVELFAVEEDGRLGKLLDVRKHIADEPIYNRYGQLTSCHPHSAVLSPSGRLLAVCDKGDSHIYLYRMNREKGKLELLNKALTSEKGCGSRYCVFHPTLPFLFVNHEFLFHGRLAVCAFRYDEDGGLERICDVDAVPADYVFQDGTYYQQQGLAIHPSGRYLYSVVNGLRSIAVFAIDQEAGSLQLIENAEIPKGDWPRAVTISPDGSFLIYGCLSGEIEVLRIGEDGRLCPTGFREQLQGSSYFCFYDPAKGAQSSGRNGETVV